MATQQREQTQRGQWLALTIYPDRTELVTRAVPDAPLARFSDRDLARRCAALLNLFADVETSQLETYASEADADVPRRLALLLQ